MPRHFVVSASAVELVQIAGGGHNATMQMPPAGTTFHFDASTGWADPTLPFDDTRLPFYVAGNVAAGQEDTWFWGTIGDVVTEALVGGPDQLQSVLEHVASFLSKTLGALSSTVLLKKGTANSDMRWIRTTLRGQLGGGVEQFQHKLDLGLPGADPDLDEGERDALATQLAALWTTAWTANAGSWSAQVQYLEIGVAQVTQTSATNVDGTGGNQEATMTSWVLFPVGVGALQGSGIAPDLPYEVACAVSLQTEHRGPSGRGRLYLPPMRIGAMSAGGIFSGTAVAEAGSLIQDYINAIKSDTPHVPVVVSPRRIILNEVTSLNVGVVPDSQRRRRRNQDEARLIISLA